LAVTVEAIELIKSSTKMIKCELFSHVYFAMPPLTCNWAILTHSVNLAFETQSGFKNNCWTRTGYEIVIFCSRFKMRFFYNSRKSCSLAHCTL